ncbi:alpha/beta hydrolase [Jatrophihabitans fulvus]
MHPIPRRTLLGLVTGALVVSGAGATGASTAAAAPAATTASSSSTAPKPVGSWRVQRLTAGRWQVSWTAPRRLPVRSDRPEIVTRSGAAIGVPVTAGRTVRTVVAARTRPDARALQVVLSGRRLDRTTTSRPAMTPAAVPRAAAAPVPDIGLDPGVPGPYATTSSDYVRPSVKVAGMAAPIEMVGHVVEPVAGAATGPRPLVLFLHGRHEYCYQARKGEPDYDWPCRGVMREVPSQLGYVYAQQLLASQGYTTVSIRTNGINAQDGDLADGGASARATIVQRHLDYWATIATAHQVDLSRVVLVGHSRGGEGVDRAAIRIPTSAPYRVVGQVLIAPTDFASQTASDVPTVTLLPYCDGDVSDLQGQRFTDIARDQSAGPALHSSVLVMGANHNYFNSEWTPGVSVAPSSDDWGGDPSLLCGTKTSARLSAAAQRSVGKAYVAGAVRMFTDAAESADLLPLFDGSQVAVPSAGRALVYSHAVGGDRDVRRPGRDTTLTLPFGADSSFCTGATSDDYRPDLCGSELSGITTPLWPARDEQPVAKRTFWQVRWTAAHRTAGLHLARELDLRSRVLDLRTIVDPRYGPVRLRVTVVDADGHTAAVVPEGGGTVDPLPASPPGDYDQAEKLWAQTVRIDPQSVAGSVDLAHVAAVGIVGDSSRGQVWVADLAASVGTVPAASGTRLPTLSVGSVSVPEGNAGGTRIARVPFTLSRPMDRAGRFVVSTQGDDAISNRVFAVDLAPGQQSGTIPVGYLSDRLDSPSRLATVVLVGATTNVVTDRYVGALTVLDDDPAPTVTLTPVRSVVREGSSAQWRLTLSSPVAYETYVAARVVFGPGRDLRGADVPAAWLREHAYEPGTAAALAALDTELFVDLPAGRRSAVLAIPTVRDRVKEGTEAVTLRASVAGLSVRQAPVTRTVRVLS